MTKISHNPECCRDPGILHFANPFACPWGLLDLPKGRGSECFTTQRNPGGLLTQGEKDGQKLYYKG